MSWFITPKQKFTAAMLVVLTIIFGALMALSFADGTEVLNASFLESQFEQQEAKPENVKTFTLDSSSLCKLKIKGETLDQSWIWAKVIVLDGKDRPVLDYKFNLSYYHGYEGGESWSEGDRDDYKMVRLPKGTYKVMVYAEDEPDTTRRNRFGAKGYSTINRNERLNVTVSKGVWMTRYFAILFGVFGALTLLYGYIRSERSKYETPATYPEGYSNPYEQNPNDPNHNV